jgi:uncharacterized protein
MKIQISLPLEKINEFCKNHHVKELSLFGSVLREGFKPDSDVDILVSFNADASVNLMDFVEMQDELKVLLNREVDLVEKEALSNPFLRYSILSHKETIYAA